MLKAPESGSSTTTKNTDGSPSTAMEKGALIPTANEVVAATSVRLAGADGLQQAPVKTTTTGIVDLGRDGGSKQPSHVTSTSDDTCDEVRLVSGLTVEAKGKAVQQELEGRSDPESNSNAPKSPQEEASRANVAREHHDNDIGSIPARSREEEKDATATDVSQRGCDSSAILSRSSSKVGECAIQGNEEEIPAGKRVAGEVGVADASTLQLAEKALVALYEVHDKFFSADKGEKEVGELALSSK